MYPFPDRPASRPALYVQYSAGAATSAPTSVTETTSVFGQSISSGSRLQITNSLPSTRHDLFEQKRDTSTFRDNDSPRSASTISKGKWRAGMTPSHLSEQLDENKSPESSPHKYYWVAHTTRLLQEYANRQIALPLVNRVDLNLRQSSQILLGSVQLLANREPEKKNAKEMKPRYSLPPQLLDGFVDLERWTKEYLRSQFGEAQVGNLVPTLLTILSNNFYEAHMHVMDSVVKHALSNKEARKGACLDLEDFAFGFDLHMNQEMPFSIQANHRVRDNKDLQRELFPSVPVPSTEASPPAVQSRSSNAKQRIPPKSKPKTVKQAPKAEPPTPGPSKPKRGKQPLSKKKQDAPIGALQQQSSLKPSRRNQPIKPSPLSTVIRMDVHGVEGGSALGNLSGAAAGPSSLGAKRGTRDRAFSADTIDRPTPDTLIGYESDTTVKFVPPTAKIREESEESADSADQSESAFVTDMPNGVPSDNIPGPQEPKPVPGRSTIAPASITASHSEVVPRRSSRIARALTCPPEDVSSRDPLSHSQPTPTKPAHVQARGRKRKFDR